MKADWLENICYTHQQWKLTDKKSDRERETKSWEKKIIFAIYDWHCGNMKIVYI